MKREKKRGKKKKEKEKKGDVPPSEAEQFCNLKVESWNSANTFGLKFRVGDE